MLGVKERPQEFVNKLEVTIEKFLMSELLPSSLLKSINVREHAWSESLEIDDSEFIIYRKSGHEVFDEIIDFYRTRIAYKAQKFKIYDYNKYNICKDKLLDLNAIKKLEPPKKNKLVNILIQERKIELDKLKENNGNSFRQVDLEDQISLYSQILSNWD